MRKNIPHIVGFWSAITALLFVFVYGLFQVIIESVPLSGMKESICMFLPPFLLAPLFLLIVISLHYSVGRDNKIWTSVALSIATIYCAQITMLYIMEFAMPFEDIQQRHWVFYQGLFDRQGFLMGIDALTYFFISLSSLFLAVALRGNMWIFRTLLWVTILIPILLLTFFFPLFYFAGLIWFISFTIAMIEIAFFFRESSKANLNAVS